MMRHSLVVKGDVPALAVRDWMQRPLERLQRRLEHLPPGSVHLRVAVRSGCSKRRAQAALALDLPCRHLAVSEENVEMRIALHDAFAELERRLDRELGRLRSRRAHSVRDAARRSGELLDRLGAPWPVSPMRVPG